MNKEQLKNILPTDHDVICLVFFFDPAETTIAIS